MKALKAIDLFSGIGGVKLGLEQAGFDVIYSNDIDNFCKQTFETNFPQDSFDLKDVRKLSLDDIPDHDLLAAGFPCQPFSLAGLKKGFNDPRGNLFQELIRILKGKQPKAFILENVKHLKHHNSGKTFELILNDLKGLGYNVYWEILNSKDFGLPQNRQRIYIVGFREKTKFNFPQAVSMALKISDILESNVDEWYFLSQKYYEGLSNHKLRHKVKGSGFGFEILDKEGISHALVVGNMGRERNLIQDIPRKGFFKEGTDKKLKNKFGVRKLTIRECARLQGFPEDFTFPVSRTQAYKQLGNSVSVPVIRAVAKNIYAVLEQSKAYYQSLNILHLDNM